MPIQTGAEEAQESMEVLERCDQRIVQFTVRAMKRPRENSYLPPWYPLLLDIIREALERVEANAQAKSKAERGANARGKGAS